MSITLPDGSWILHERAPTFVGATGAGALSVKTMVGGRALYEVGDARYAVGAESYLILNHGRPYTVRIDSRTPVESFCLFFGPGVAEEVHRSLVTPAARLLDDPEGPAAPLGFVERLYPHDALLTPALRALRSAMRPGAAPERDRLVERMHDAAARLLAVQRAVRSEIARLPAARASTRDELYRRLYRARDWMDASLAGPVRLSRAAAVACLSPHHFLRSFRAVFGETPHQYLTHRRLDRARALLAETDAPVTRICVEVGFESLGSFSSLFRRHTGLGPEAYRAARSGGASG